MSDLTYREQKTLNGKRDRVLEVARKISAEDRPFSVDDSAVSSAGLFGRLAGLAQLCTELRSAVRDLDAYLEEIGEANQ
ncbi:MAG: hypothetical protein GTN69_10540 [Armatimonadetes bacterium]|nr:hypothetical protein [Armatimonadota bacterium]